MRTKLTVNGLKRAARGVALLIGVAVGVACGSAETDHAPGASAGAAGQSGNAAQAGTAGSSAGAGGSEAGGAGNAGGRENGGAAGSEAGGGAGEAGSPSACSAVVTRYCDDSNGCTEDSCDPLLGCQHRALADGSQCDDGDSCTHADSCSAGQCLGTASVSAAEVLGQLSSFGSYDELDDSAQFQGLSIALSETRLIFAEPTDPGLSLKLVAADSPELRLLDSAFTYASLKSVGIGLWTFASETHLLALSSTRFALVTTGHDIEIYDLVSDHIVLRAYRYLLSDGLGTTAIIGAAGHDNRLWLTDGGSLFGYDIASGVDATITPLATVQPHQFVDAQALSGDKNTLYIGNQRGVFRIDVSDPQNALTDPMPVATEQPEHRPYHLEAQGNYLMIQDDVLYASPGDLRIVSSSDFSKVATFSADSLLNPSFSAPTGGAFVDGGFVLQRIQYENSKPSKLTAELYALDQNGATLEDQRLLRDLAAAGSTVDWQPLQPVAAGRLAVLGPVRQVLSTAGAMLSELHGLQEGSFDRVLPGTAGRALVYGSQSTQLVDLSDPASPRILAGGSLTPGSSNLLRVSLPSGPGDTPRLLNVGQTPSYASGRWRIGDGQLTQFGSDGSQLPVPSGQLTLAGRDAQTVAGGVVFQISVQPDGSFQLATFALPREPSSPATALETVSLAGSVPITQPGSSTVAASADARNFVLIIEDLVAPTLQWFSRTSESWALKGSVPLPASSDRVLIVQDQRALIGSPSLSGAGGGGGELDLVGFDSDGNLVVQVTRVFPQAGANFLKRVLGFDGNRAYITLGEADASINTFHAQVQEIALDTLAPIATYAVPEFPGTVTVVGDQLVFGARNALITATPACLSAP